MKQSAIAILDTGKTFSKISLWDSEGRLITRRSRANEVIDTGKYLALDIEGIGNWLAISLKEFAKLPDIEIEAFVPVSHGAAAVIVKENKVLCPPMDYEQEIPEDVRERYRHIRDTYNNTGSPLLTSGLNLGLQLFWLEELKPDLLNEKTIILPLAQYWSWLLCGVAASEISSFGCHTDLWRPFDNQPSTLSTDQGWDKHFAPIKQASEVLGTINQEWATKTGLPKNMKVFCGLHDSNAALFAARSIVNLKDDDCTILSTGTWFVAMRSIKNNTASPLPYLDERRDCLINIDIEGNPIPSARFMGGRELENLMNNEDRIFSSTLDEESQLCLLKKIIENNVFIFPNFSSGNGPFPNHIGQWQNKPDDPEEILIASHLYLALITSEMITLLGSKNTLLVEGKFSRNPIFVKCLAGLQKSLKILVANFNSDVSYGALRLIKSDCELDIEFREVTQPDFDLTTYQKVWEQKITACG